MITDQRSVSDSAIIELLETKSFFLIPKIYRNIIRSAEISDKERYFIYELFFDFLEYWRKGSNNNRLSVTVQQLAEKYNRSKETIRRYLRALENVGLIRKVLTTIRQAGKILTPIIGIDFVLPDKISRDALLQDDRNSVDKSEKNLPADNKNDHSPQVKEPLQDNKTVEQLLDQDQIEELLDLIILFTEQNNYKNTIDKKSLFYIIKRFKDQPFFMGFQLIKRTISQMLFDLNKDGWHTDDMRFRLNIMLKKIANNTYKIYIKLESPDKTPISNTPDKNNNKSSKNKIIEYLESQIEQGICIKDFKSSKTVIQSWLNKSITVFQVESALNLFLEKTGTVSIDNINKSLFKC